MNPSDPTAIPPLPMTVNNPQSVTTPSTLASEPVVVGNAIPAFVAAAVAIVTGFGWYHPSADQTTAITAGLAALVAVITPLVRSRTQPSR